MFKKIKLYLNINNLVLAVAMLVSASWVWGTVEAIQRNFVLQQRVDSLKQEVDYQDLQNETLKFQQRYFATNEFVELSARERLNKALPDEKLLILPVNTVKDQPASVVKDTTKLPITKRPNIEQWIYFLLGDKS